VRVIAKPPEGKPWTGTRSKRHRKERKENLILCICLL